MTKLEQILKFFGLAKYYELEKARKDIGKLSFELDVARGMIIIEKGKIIKSGYYAIGTTLENKIPATFSLGVSKPIMETVIEVKNATN